MSEYITYEYLVCDAPDCGHTHPDQRCARCRSAYYCSSQCQRKDYLQHKKECVEFAEKGRALLQPKPFHKVTSVAENKACPVCQREPIVDVIILDECHHGICYRCLSFWQKQVEDKTQGQEIPACPQCQKTKYTDIDEILWKRANLFAENAKRDDVTEQEQKENYNLAIAELNKLTQPSEEAEEFARKDGSFRDFSKTVDEGRLLQAELFLREKEAEKALAVLEKARKLEMSRAEGYAQETISKESDRGNENEVKRTLELLEKLHQGQEAGRPLDIQILRDLYRDIAAVKRVLRINLLFAKTLESKKDWEKALQHYQMESTCISSELTSTEQTLEIQTGLSRCSLETGDLTEAQKIADIALQANRRSAGVHKTLAHVLKAKGDMEEARKTMNQAVLYEEPWNENNKKNNMKLFDELCEEIRDQEARRRLEEAFTETWGSVLELLQADQSYDRPTSWASIKTKSYDMLGAIGDDDDEEEDDESLREATQQKLESAAASAAAASVEEEGNNEQENEEFFDTMQSIDESGGVEKVDSVADLALPAPREFDNILFTKNVLKWQKHAHPEYRKFFIGKIKRLAAGDRSHKLAKPLKGSKAVMFEAYLEQKSGQRIIWTEDSTKGIVIWYVAKHKEVSRLMTLIDNAAKRSSRQLTLASALPEIQDEVTASENDFGHLALDDVMLDPCGDTPLKLYEVRRDDIEKLNSTNWQPPLHLTPEERSIVETPGTVLLLGRSGTGKTVCICNRIDFDRHHFGGISSFSQLFVARSQRICNYVEDTVGGTREVDDGSRVTVYRTYNKLLKQCEDALAESEQSQEAATDSSFVPPSFRVDKRMTFKRFKHNCYREEWGLDALVVWTQIRSFIKGSIASVLKCRRAEGRLDGFHRSREEYLELGTRECRLEAEQRERAYDAFESYMRYMDAEGMWDECDRAISLLNQLLCVDETTRESLKYDKVYVDEIQDYTQSEIALFFLLCRQGGLFFAGDPAQSVVEGVDFRFEDVRSVAYYLYKDEKNKDRFIPEKPRTVNVNFRSHAGILNVAAAVLDLLFSTFPGSAKELPRDEGLFIGPRPAVFQYVKDAKLKELVDKIDGVVLLAMNEQEVKWLQDLVGPSVVVLSIRDSKGLEFPDVIIVDFFKSLAKEHRKPWRQLLQGKKLEAIRPGYPELETHLKQLYTAITRCSQRLFIAETGPSIPGEAFFRWILDKEKAKKQDVEDVAKMVKTPDEWSATGIDYAMNAEAADEIEQAEFWLGKAMHCFEQGEDHGLMNKAAIHRSSLALRRKLEDESQTEIRPADLEDEAAELLQKLVEQGLLLETRKVCDLLLPLLENYARKALEQRALPLLPEADD